MKKSDFKNGTSANNGTFRVKPAMSKKKLSKNFKKKKKKIPPDGSRDFSVGFGISSIGAILTKLAFLGAIFPLTF
jgi:peptidoglycan hydrolase-like protein with peptidoglycan-binding domain